MTDRKINPNLKIAECLIQVKVKFSPSRQKIYLKSLFHLNTIVDYDLSTGVIQGNINELLQTYFSDVKP